MSETNSFAYPTDIAPENILKNISLLSSLKHSYE